MSIKIDPAAEVFARRQRLEHFARDAERAREEYEAASKAIDERTERLRRQRLAREAGKAGAKRKAGPKSPATGRRAAPKASKRKEPPRDA